MGKVHDYASRGLPLDAGWALDALGEPTTDAVEAMQGSIAPFGGPKGYALGLALEVLIGSLTGSALGTAVLGTLDSVNRCNKGDVFIAMRGPSASYLHEVSAFLQEVRETAPARADAPVLVPGDDARTRRAANVSEGFDVADSVWESVVARVPGDWAT